MASSLIIIIFQGKLDLFQNDIQTYYKLKKAPIATVGMAAASTTEEKLLLQIIGEVGSKGIW